MPRLSQNVHPMASPTQETSELRFEQPYVPLSKVLLAFLAYGVQEAAWERYVPPDA